MRQFIDSLAAGSVVADVGCGNGKYFMVRQDIAVLGSDRSSALAQVAATRLAAGSGAASGALLLLCLMQCLGHQAVEPAYSLMTFVHWVCQVAEPGGL